MTLDFVTLSPRDGEQLAQLNAISFPSDWGERWSARDIVSAFSMSGVTASAAMLVDAPSPAKMVAFVLSRCVVDEVEILLLGVDPAYRQRGIAKALLDEFMQDMQTKAISRIFLEVRESNASARALYKSAGFQSVGERANYYRTKTGKTAKAFTLEKRIKVAPI
ncbi:MAG: ribosomal protein S18-alanine N-acetyltransferase [Pseudomonadota bacterium]